MKLKYVLPLLLLLLLTACKKDRVDSTNLQTFQSSINDMTSSLKTLEQTKFNEALYILKTFGVEADGDTYELTALSKLIAGKNVAEIMKMADEVAAKNGIAWSSTAPPSLGEMNVFGDDKPEETDANNISATGLDIIIREHFRDSTAGPDALQVIPRLIDRKGMPVSFEGAALETTMEVYSGGQKVKTAKNLIQASSFPGFTLRLNTLAASQIVNNAIDITMSVKTSKKTFRFSKMGIPVNPAALRQPTPAAPAVSDNTADTDDPLKDSPEEAAAGGENPKRVVQQFLRNVSAQNLEAAYQLANNPGWSSYDQFANPTTGFGSIKDIKVHKIAPATVTDNSATISAAYEVTGKNGNTSTVNVSFGLQNNNGEWKITSYRIN